LADSPNDIEFEAGDGSELFARIGQRRLAPPDLI